MQNPCVFYFNGGILLSTRIIKRCRQLHNALFSKITEEDRVLLKLYLNTQEQQLFYGMDEKVQKHCINVAKTIITSIDTEANQDTRNLIRGAFLHDIGKMKGTFCLIDRVVYVLIKKIFPRMTVNLADNNHRKFLSRFRRAIYYNLYHPVIGAQMAKSSGLDDRVVFLIENHHNITQISSNSELKKLSAADELH